MADKLHFVSKFRSDILTMSNAYTDVMEDIQFLTTEGWVQTDFDEALTASDITPAQLFSAISALQAIAATFASGNQAISTMLP